MFWQYNDDFFLDNIMFKVVYIVDFVEDDEFDIVDDIGFMVKYIVQNFCSYDEIVGFWVDLNIISQNINFVECLFEVMEFLVVECFDWGCVNSFCYVFCCKSNGVFSYYCFVCRSMGCDEY